MLKTLSCIYRKQRKTSDSVYSMRILQAARNWKAAKKSSFSNMHRNHQSVQNRKDWRDTRKWSYSSIPVPKNNCLSSFSVSQISLRKLSIFHQLNIDFYWQFCSFVWFFFNISARVHMKKVVALHIITTKAWEISPSSYGSLKPRRFVPQWNLFHCLKTRGFFWCFCFALFCHYCCLGLGCWWWLVGCGLFCFVFF